MANYNSFLFRGHGKSTSTGKFDPGACNGQVTEYDLANKMVLAAKKYLDATGLKIHYDEGNLSDKDLNGNTYTAKKGMVVHINSAVGASGSEILVPCKNASLSIDVKTIQDLSSYLGIPNRGVKSRSGNTWYKRVNGQSVNASDYFGEIRDAWSRGIALCILEVGFIQNDLSIMQNNIDGIGKIIAEYIASSCGKTLSGTLGTSTVTQELYRVRKSWEDSKSQIGAYSNLDNAKKICDENLGTKVFNDKGEVIYPVSDSATSEIYRVRKSWEDSKSQIGAYSNLDNAKKSCDENKDTKVFNKDGKVVYEPKATVTEISEDTIGEVKTPIIGESKIDVQKLVKFIKVKNPDFDKEIAENFLSVGKTYNVRGDIALCQSIHETGWFKFTGDVKPNQHNYAGIGATGNGNLGNSFPTIKEGVTAQIQHLFAYACNDSLPSGEDIVDPRFNYVTRGKAKTFEDLGGAWAVPGYNTSSYSSFEEAYNAKETYGQKILKIYEEALKFNPTVEEVLETPKIEEEVKGYTEQEDVIDKFSDLIKDLVRK